MNDELISDALMMEDFDALMIEAGVESTLGSDIPRDESCIVLAARTTVHPGLPRGNEAYEATIDSLIKDKNIRQIRASHVHEVLKKKLGVKKKLGRKL